MNNVIKPKPEVTFVGVPCEGDTYGINVMVNGKFRGRLNFVEAGMKPMRCCLINGPNLDGMGWRGSKMQSEAACAELADHYANGRLE
jgi:hypothetical protein